MKLLANQKGIALITALMLTLISLTIVMYLMYMITAGVKMSGANKRYKTAIEASYGATDIVLKELFKTMFDNIGTPATGLSSYGLSSVLNLTTTTDSCLQQKLTSPRSMWSASCSSSNDAKQLPDITLRLNSTSGDPFAVYTKIVDTVCSDKRPYPVGKCTGSDLSGVDYLDGGSGVAGSSSVVATQSMPAIYRIEVQAERYTNPQEKAKLSILYSY